MNGINEATLSAVLFCSLAVGCDWNDYQSADEYVRKISSAAANNTPVTLREVELFCFNVGYANFRDTISINDIEIGNDIEIPNRRTPDDHFGFLAIVNATAYLSFFLPHEVGFAPSQIGCFDAKKTDITFKKSFYVSRDKEGNRVKLPDGYVAAVLESHNK